MLLRQALHAHSAWTQSVRMTGLEAHASLHKYVRHACISTLHTLVRYRTHHYWACFVSLFFPFFVCG